MLTSAYSTAFSIRGATATLLWLCLLGCVGMLGWTLYQDYTHSQTATQTSNQPYNQTSNPASADVSQASRSQQQSGSENQKMRLSAANLFGTPGATPARTAQQHIPDTRLKLELKGAFSSSDNNRASALVAEKGKNAKRYYVNDSLPGGAVLTQVNADHVTLSRGGQLEVLRFPKPIQTQSSINNQLASHNNLSSQARSNRNNNTGNAQRNNPQRSDARTESIKERLMRLRQNKN